MSEGFIIISLLSLALGFGAGVAHFHSLQSVTRRLLAGELAAIPLQLMRLALLATILVLLAQVSWYALVACALGITLARIRVLAQTPKAS